jgi:hypothetical protein
MNKFQDKDDGEAPPVDSDTNYSAQIRLFEGREKDLNKKLSNVMSSNEQSIYSTIDIMRAWLKEKDDENTHLEAQLKTLQATIHQQDIDIAILREQLMNQENRRCSVTSINKFKKSSNQLNYEPKHDPRLEAQAKKSIYKVSDPDNYTDESSLPNRQNIKDRPSIYCLKSSPSEDDAFSRGISLASPSVASSTHLDCRKFVQDYRLSDPYGDSGYYTGTILKTTGMPHGCGGMKYDQHRRTYDGEWRHGRWHGKGKATEANGDCYEGEYQRDLRHGKGKLIWPDGRVYEGDFKVDKRYGKGKMVWPDGARYYGEFRNGKLEGKGRISVPGGGYYDGNWKQDCFDGFGGKLNYL